MKEKKTILSYSQSKYVKISHLLPPTNIWKKIKPNYNILRRKQWQPVKMTRFGVPLIFQVYLSFAIMTKDLVAKYRWQKKGLG